MTIIQVTLTCQENMNACRDLWPTTERQRELGVPWWAASTEAISWSGSRAELSFEVFFVLVGLRGLAQTFSSNVSRQLKPANPNETRRVEETVLYGENDGMSEAREVVERFYERFGEGEMTEAFALFATDCISLTPSGALNNEKHEAVARNLKHAIPVGTWKYSIPSSHVARSSSRDGSREPTETISQHRLERSSPPTTRPVLHRLLPSGERKNRRV
jgi:hypothetical protein